MRLWAGDSENLLHSATLCPSRSWAGRFSAPFSVHSTKCLAQNCRRALQNGTVVLVSRLVSLSVSQSSVLRCCTITERRTRAGWKPAPTQGSFRLSSVMETCLYAVAVGCTASIRKKIARVCCGIKGGKGDFQSQPVLLAMPVGATLVVARVAGVPAQGAHKGRPYGWKGSGHTEQAAGAASATPLRMEGLWGLNVEISGTNGCRWVDVSEQQKGKGVAFELRGWDALGQGFWMVLG